MAMEINGNYSHYGTDYEEQMKAKREERASEAKKTEEKKESDEIPVPMDEYISSEASGRKPSGLYRLGQDENGNPKVIYDDPKKAAKKESSGKKAVNADQDENPKASEEKCVGSTDQVDREIRQLKEQKQQLEQQIKAASGDEEKVRELQAKLAQVESELSQKDNDTYRRQNSVFTNI
ncbi:MAG: hypothetical protein K2G51_01495 [Lachnospiraceae bacterium]|nr:hypothetical protein [Lachnospiraceae bacterium]